MFLNKLMLFLIRMKGKRNQNTFQQRVGIASIAGFLTSIFFFLALVSHIPFFTAKTNNVAQYFFFPGILMICLGISFIPFSLGFYFGGRKLKQKSGILSFAMGLLFSICTLIVGAVELAFFVAQEAFYTYVGALVVTIGFAMIMYFLFAILEVIYFAGTEQGTLGGVLAGVLLIVGPIIAITVSWFVRRPSPLPWAIIGGLGFFLISYIMMRQAKISFRQLPHFLSCPNI